MLKSSILSLILIFSILSITGTLAQAPKKQTVKQIYIFSADWCSYCKVLKEFILDDPAVINEMKKIKVYYINKDATSDTILKQWKIKGIPTVVAVERLDEGSVKILEYWQLSNTRRDNRKYSNNKQSFLNFLAKYSEKKS